MLARLTPKGIDYLVKNRIKFQPIINDVLMDASGMGEHSTNLEYVIEYNTLETYNFKQIGEQIPYSHGNRTSKIVPHSSFKESIQFMRIRSLQGNSRLAYYVPFFSREHADAYERGMSGGEEGYTLRPDIENKNIPIVALGINSLCEIFFPCLDTKGIEVCRDLRIGGEIIHCVQSENWTAGAGLQVVDDFGVPFAEIHPDGKIFYGMYSSRILEKTLSKFMIMSLDSGFPDLIATRDADRLRPIKTRIIRDKLLKYHRLALTRLKRELSDEETKLTEKSAIIISMIRTIETLTYQIAGHSSSEESIGRKADGHLKYLNSHPLIERIDINANCIVMLTKKIKLRPGDLELGPFKISIPFSPGAMDVMIHGQSPLLAFSMQHPHIHNPENPCWGNIAAEIMKLRRENNLVELVELILEYLQTWNTEEGAAKNRFEMIQTALSAKSPSVSPSVSPSMESAP